MKTTLIAAVARGNAIGRKGELLWHIPEDLKHFKATTMGAPVIMGRRTWESLPFRPLPGRLNIILTSQPDYVPQPAPADRIPAIPPATALDFEEALLLGKLQAAANGQSEIFIIGGEKVYAQMLPMADALELTEIPLQAPDADAFFPKFDPQEWKEVKREVIEVADPETAGEKMKIAFVRFERIK